MQVAEDDELIALAGLLGMDHNVAVEEGLLAVELFDALLAA